MANTYISFIWLSWCKNSKSTYIPLLQFYPAWNGPSWTKKKLEPNFCKTKHRNHKVPTYDQCKWCRHCSGNLWYGTMLLSFGSLNGTAPKKCNSSESPTIAVPFTVGMPAGTPILEPRWSILSTTISSSPAIIRKISFTSSGPSRVLRLQIDFPKKPPWFWTVYPFSFIHGRIASPPAF